MQPNVKKKNIILEAFRNMSESLQEQQCHYSNKTIDQSLSIMVALNSNLILLENSRAIVRKDYRNMTQKVKLVSGGKVENELVYINLVGPGMLTAAVLGNTFTGPSVDDIVRVIEEIESHGASGVLLIVQDYADYPIKFTLAQVRAEAKGYNVKLILINKNIEIVDAKNLEKRSFLHMLYVYKMAGAMSEQGRNMDVIYGCCFSYANYRGIIFLEIEHTNVTSQEPDVQVFLNLAEQMFDPVKNLLKAQRGEELYKRKVFNVGHEVAIIINHFGCNQIEANIFVLQVLKQIKICGLIARRVYVKTHVKALGLRRFQICILNLSTTPVIIKYLDFPTSVPGWPKVLALDALGMREDNQTLVMPGRFYKSDTMLDVNLKGPIIRSESGNTILVIISTACKAVIACTRQLNIIDGSLGNGDYGTRLAHGAKAIETAIQQKKITGTNPYATFLQISRIIEKTIGGSQGGIYSFFFYNVAEAFSKYQSDEQITEEIWLNVLISANGAMKELKSPIFDTTFSNVLMHVQIVLAIALNTGEHPTSAFGKAVTTAEKFNTFRDPDPEIHAVGIWMRAAFEGFKRMFKQ